MGTDIHIRIETRDEAGKWAPLLPPVKHRGDDTHHYRSWYDNRNYDVFAVLANVRNGYGFAGIYRGEPVAYISEPKGLPVGVDIEAPPEWDGYLNETCPGQPAYVDPEGDARVRYCRSDLGDHSFTWFTPDELLNAPQWKQRQRKSGVMSPREYRRMRESGEPNSWSRGISGPGIATVTPADMDVLIAAGVVDASKEDGKGLTDASAVGTDGQRYYMQAGWDVSGGIEESCSDFIAWMHDELQPLADKYGNDNVRVLIGFDS